MSPARSSPTFLLWALRTVLLVLALVFGSILLLLPQHRIVELGNRYAPDGFCGFCATENLPYRIAATVSILLLLAALWCTFRYAKMVLRGLNGLRNEFSQFRISLRKTVSLFTRWPVLVIGIVGLIIRLQVFLSPIRSDEAYTYLTYASKSLPLALTLYDSTNNHLFYTFLEYLSVHAFGGSVFAIRLPALVFGMALIPLSYLVAREIGDRRVALLTAVLVAVSPALALITTIGRGYAPAIAFSLLLLWCYLRYRAQPTLLGIIAIMALFPLMLYSLATMLYAAFAIVSLLLIDLIAARHRRVEFQRRIRHLAIGLPVTGVLTLLLYTPVLLVQGTRLFGNSRFDPIPYTVLLERLPQLFKGVLQYLGWVDWFTAALFLILVLIGVSTVRSRSGNAVRRFLLMNLLVILSLMLIPRMLPAARHLSYLIPLCFLFAATGIVHGIDAFVPQRFRTCGTLLLTGALLTIGAGYAVLGNTPDTFSWDRCAGCRDAVAYLQQHPPDAPLLIDFPADVPFQYYARQAEVSYSASYGATRHGFSSYTVLFPNTTLTNPPRWLIVPGLTFTTTTWMSAHQQNYADAGIPHITEIVRFPDFPLYAVTFS